MIRSRAADQAGVQAGAAVRPAWLLPGSIGALIALVLAALHGLALERGPGWASPLRIGDWLFTVLLALLLLAFALATGRRLGAPLLDPAGDPLDEGLAALGLGLGALSLGLLGLGLLHLYYGPVFLLLAAVLTLWLRAELARIWCGAVSGLGDWLRRGAPTAPTLGERLVLLALALISLSVALRSMLPVTEWDAVIYHLAGIKIALAAHGIVPMPDLPLANAPSGEEMLLIPGLLVGSDGLGKVLNVCLALLLAIATYRFGRRHLTAEGAWLGPLLLFSQAWVALVMPLTLVDFASALLLVLGIADGCAWVRRLFEPEAVYPRATMANLTALWPVDRLLLRAGLLCGISATCKLSNLLVLPVLALICGVAGLCAAGRCLRLQDPLRWVPHGRDGGNRGRGTGQRASIAGRAISPDVWRPVGCVLWGGRHAALAGLAGLLPVTPWLVKNLFMFGKPLYPFGAVVSNPSHGIATDATAPPAAQHLRWIVDTFGDLAWNHLGAISAALLLAPLLLRRSEQRAALGFWLLSCPLWLLFVPFFEPPRYYLGLAALGTALIAGVVGEALRRLGRRAILAGPLIVAYLLVANGPNAVAALHFVQDRTLRDAALGLTSRHDYLASHLPAYLTLTYANGHLPAGTEVALVNVVSGYYLDLPHLNDWYGSRLARLEDPVARSTELASWCTAAVRYAILDRGDGSLDENERTSVRPPASFGWTRTPGLAPRVVYSARGVDLLAVTPCMAASNLHHKGTEAQRR